MSIIGQLRTRCPYCKGKDFMQVVQGNLLKPYWDYHGTKRIEVYWCWSCSNGDGQAGAGSWWHFKVPG
jgi:hypothetical protein